jgi:hypothetical protein
MGKSNRGHCTICLSHGKLTNDHVPPKGSHAPSRVWIQSVAPTLRKPDERIPRRHSQNGMKFRTICARCNNDLLGRRYDPALNYMSTKVRQIVRAAGRLALPTYLTVSIQPQRVARAVIGHLLAADEAHSKQPRKAPMIDAMRGYFLDETKELPDNLRLFFRPYRGLRQTVLRGVGVMFGFTQVSPPPIVVGDFLKYFPIAFCLASDPPEQIATQLQGREIDPRGLALDDEVGLPVPTGTADTFAPDWPEHPTGFEALLLNDKACVYAEPS